MHIDSQLAQLNQSFMDKSAANLKKSVEAMATGLRSNSDRPSSDAIVSRMTAQIDGTEMASRNSMDAVSLTQTAEAAMSSQIEQLQQTRELAVQASNGTLAQSDRVSLNNQAQELLAESEETSQNTAFNGQSLLNNSTPAIQIQTGSNNAQTTTVKLPDTSQAALGITSVDLTSQASAQTAIKDIDSALEKLQTSSSDMGASRNSFERRIETNDVEQISTERSRSRIRDTDYAQEQANFLKEQIMQETQTAMRSHSQVAAQQVLSLLR